MLSGPHPQGKSHLRSIKRQIPRVLGALDQMFIFYYTTAPQPQEHHSWGDLSGGGAKPWARARMQRALLAALGAQWLGQSLPSTPCFLLRWMGTPPVPETERADSPFPALNVCRHHTVCYRTTSGPHNSAPWLRQERTKKKFREVRGPGQGHPASEGFRLHQQRPSVSIKCTLC